MLHSTMASMPKQSRHLACTLCRDRKVKCDGARPSCEKCTKAGETCVYAVNTKTSIAELQETIHKLQERIEQAESNKSAWMGPHQTASDYASRLPLVFDAPSLEPFATFDQQHLADTRQTAFASNLEGSAPISRSLQSCTEDGTAISPFESRPSHFLPLGSHPDPTESTKMTSARLMADMMLSPAVIEQENRTESNLSSSPVVVDDNRDSNHSRLPSIRNVQEWAWRTTCGLDCGGANTSNDDLLNKEEAAERLLSEFISLNTFTESAQYNIIGMANAAAMYASYYLRQASLDGMQNLGGLLRFIEILEHRMREISKIASQQVLGQTRKSREAVRIYGTYRDRMEEVENEQRRHAATRSDFFRTRYDLSCSLSQQI